ncbi:hypothetical protein HN011_003316, partial [Eciton burchellii]
DKDNVCLIFAAQNNVAEKKKENEINVIEYDDEDDEIDELKEVMKQLEPKYRHYANWRI